MVIGLALVAVGLVEQGEPGDPWSPVIRLGLIALGAVFLLTTFWDVRKKDRKRGE